LPLPGNGNDSADVQRSRWLALNGHWQRHRQQQRQWVV